MSTRSPNTLRFHSGWRLLLRRVAFLILSLKYALQPRCYPLFTYNPFRNGFLKTLRIGWSDLKLHRSVEFNGAHFAGLTVPHFPSPAYDHMVASGGLNIAAAGTPLKRHMDTVILGITRRCDLHCLHCYERFNTADHDTVPIERWKEVLRQVQQVGANIIVLSGGEPMARFDGALELLESGDKNLSDFHLHTSGQGVTLDRARQLHAAGLTAAAVGLDDVDPIRHDRLRGSTGAHRTAVKALNLFREAGVFTYVNLCLSRELIRSGDLWRYYEMARSLNVGFIQMLEPRPCGGYLTNGQDVLLTEQDRELAKQFFLEANTHRRYRDYPIIHYVAHAESPENLGCLMGGLSHLYIDSVGNVNPCVFLPVTFGSILEEDFPPIYHRMRAAAPHPIRKLCPSLLMAETIRAHALNGQSSPIRYSQVADEWSTLVND